LVKDKDKYFKLSLLRNKDSFYREKSQNWWVFGEIKKKEKKIKNFVLIFLHIFTVLTLKTN